MHNEPLSEVDTSADGRPAEAISNGLTGAADFTADAPTEVKGLLPYYHDDLVDIYNADSTELHFLADRSVQLVVTSPPYNLGKDYGTARDDATYIGYLGWVKTWCRELRRVHLAFVAIWGGLMAWAMFGSSLPQDTYSFAGWGNIVRFDGLDFFEYQQEQIWTPEVWKGLSGSRGSSVVPACTAHPGRACTREVLSSRRLHHATSISRRWICPVVSASASSSSRPSVTEGRARTTSRNPSSS